MSANISSKEIVQLRVIKENETFVEHKKLRNGDKVVRNAIGEVINLTNGIQISIRPGCFRMSAAQEVMVERSRAGMTTVVFSNGDELKFNDDGIQSLKRDMLIFQFTRCELLVELQDDAKMLAGNSALHCFSASV